jgi:hypothetical protein
MLTRLIDLSVRFRWIVALLGRGLAGLWRQRS